MPGWYGLIEHRFYRYIEPYVPTEEEEDEFGRSIGLLGFRRYRIFT